MASADPEADTAEIEVRPTTEVATALSRHTAVASGTPLPWPLIWLATTFLVIAALTIVAIASTDGHEPPVDDASAPITSTPTRRASTTTVSTATVPPTASDPAQQSPATSLAAACADLDAQNQALDNQRHQVQETHRHDRDTRAVLKRQVEDQQHAVAAQTRALGC